jgi:RNA polymerase sigma factor (TIGR02999 family)
MPEPRELTELLLRWSRGEREALEALLPAVYHELRRAARAKLARERSGHSLQPTDLVHEAFMRLEGYERISWQNRAHFYAVAARVMRQVLIDRARKRRAVKRGGPERTVTLTDSGSPTQSQDVDVLALHQALTRLGERDPRQCEVVELRYFGGLSQEEIAAVLGVSVPTVKRDWRVAKLWLRRELAPSGA